MNEMSEDYINDSSEATENPGQKIADENLTEGQNASKNVSESNEKNFFEVQTEFDRDKIKEFRENLLNADEKQTREIIDRRISFLEESCDKVDTISPDTYDQHVHRGYIGSDTSVGFQGGGGMDLASRYKLKDTGYLYEAVSFLQDNKEKIDNQLKLFDSIEGFLNSYFGIPDAMVGDNRVNLIEKKIDWGTTDEEAFAASEKIDISIFKGEHVAMCAEHAAMAQNILSLFGYETYYINGNANIDGKSEGHAFNVLSDNSGQKNVVDFSITSTLEYRGSNWIVPTVKRISNFDQFLSGGRVSTFSYNGHVNENGEIIRKKAHDVEYDLTPK